MPVHFMCDQWFVDSTNNSFVFINDSIFYLPCYLSSPFQVVCASVKSNKLLIFDVGYVSSDPVEVNFHSYLLLHFLVKSCLHWHYVASYFLSKITKCFYFLLLIFDTTPNSVDMNFLLHYIIIVKSCPVIWFCLIIC